VHRARQVHRPQAVQQAGELQQADHREVAPQLAPRAWRGRTRRTVISGPSTTSTDTTSTNRSRPPEMTR
jgi:hypothetical protein